MHRRQATSPTSNLIKADSRPLFLVDEEAVPLFNMIDFFMVGLCGRCAVWVDREINELVLFL